MTAKGNAPLHVVRVVEQSATCPCGWTYHGPVAMTFAERHAATGDKTLGKIR